MEDFAFFRNGDKKLFLADGKLAEKIEVICFSVG
jgi:hypothetical protein